MAADSDGYIDIRGDGRIVLYKRQHPKNPKWQARISVPNATGYKVVSTKLSDLEEAKRFALNLYEELYMQVKAERLKGQSDASGGLQCKQVHSISVVTTQGQTEHCLGSASFSQGRIC